MKTVVVDPESEELVRLIGLAAVNDALDMLALTVDEAREVRAIISHPRRWRPRLRYAAEIMAWRKSVAGRRITEDDIPF